MRIKVPTEIHNILVKIEAKKKTTDDEKLALRTYLGTLEEAVINPANPAKELNNPFPMEVDVSLGKQERLEDTVRRIMSVSARIAQSRGFETPAEADDFDVADGFEVMPNSPFELVDHFQPMQPERPIPPSTSKESQSVSDSPKSEAGVSTSPEPEAA